MTDKELRDAAVVELKKTTQGYLKSNGQPRDTIGTQWKKGLDLLAQIGQTAPPPPPPAGKKPLAYIRLSNGDPPASHYDDYARMLVSFRGGADWSGRDVSRVVAYTSPFRLLVGQEWNGMSAEEARANNWLLKDANGAEIGATWAGDDRMADIGDSAYQIAWCQKIESYFGSRGVKGFYMDDFNRASWLCESTPAKYPSVQTWEAAVVSLAKFVGDYFKPKGWYVAVNASGYTPGSPTSSNGDDDVAFYTKIGPHMSAIMCEYFQVTSSGVGRVSGSSVWTQWWDQWQRLPVLCNSLGVDLIAMATNVGAALRDYSLCSFLLNWDGQRGMFAWLVSSGDPNQWNLTYDKVLTLGQPTAAKSKSGNVWRRTFQNGTVEVDSVAGTSRVL